MFRIEFRQSSGWTKQLWDESTSLWDGVDEKTDEQNRTATPSSTDR